LWVAQTLGLCPVSVIGITPITMTLGESIRRHRQAKGLRLADLAAAIGTDAGTMSRIETGKREPSLAQLRAIARAFGLRAGRLLDADHPRSMKRQSA